MRFLVIAFIAFASANLFGNTLSVKEVTDWTGVTHIVKATAPGAFTISGNGTVISKSKLPVLPEKVYEFRGEFANPTGKTGRNIYFGLVCYDKDGKIIMPQQVMTVPGTDTVLAEECMFTDQKIKIKNGANWKTSANHCVAFNSKADRSDLPNKNITRPGIREIKKISDDVWEVTLNKEIGFEYPAQTPVREHQSGATYIYYVAGQIPAEGKVLNVSFKAANLRPGTASVAIVAVFSGDRATPIAMKDISILEK